MKATRLLPLLAAVLVSSVTAAQTYYRINNNLTGANIFSTLQDAVVHAQANLGNNPIFIVEGSNTPYDPATSFVIDFPVIIYGTGYYLDENPETQADTRDSEINNITFDAGSEGSEVYGCVVSTLTVSTSDITVSKCQIRLGLNIDAPNATVTKNFIEGSTSGDLVSVNAATNLVFMNNLVHNTNPAGTGNLRMDNSSAGLILYNSFWGSVDNVLHNATVQGNYFNDSEFDLTTTSSNLTVSSNAMDESMNFLSLPAGGTDPGFLAVPDSVFCLGAADPGSMSTDGQYQTNLGGYDPDTDNPIFDGTDTNFGMYGGTNPYLLSGMPRIPSVYEYTGSGTGTGSSGTSSTVKSKTHK